MPNLQNCLLVHGCPSTNKDKDYNKHWIQWAKRNLIDAGLKTEAPLMPEPWAPNYEKFKQEFEKHQVNEDTVLIGHSCGCAFLVRWLGESKQKVAKLILVAPWKIPDPGDTNRKRFYTYEIDESVKSRVGETVMFTSNNEEEAGKDSLKIFHNALGGKIVNLKDHGHYTFEDMGTEEFPELLEEVISFDKRKALLIPINSKKQILIQDRRGYKKPDWGFFGGGIEGEETPLEAVTRETREELQIDVHPEELEYLGVYVTNKDEVKIIRYIFLYPTDRKEFFVLEGNSGQWLTFEEVDQRLDPRVDNPYFSRVVRKINEVLD